MKRIHTVQNEFNAIKLFSERFIEWYAWIFFKPNACMQQWRPKVSSTQINYTKLSVFCTNTPRKFRWKLMAHTNLSSHDGHFRTSPMRLIVCSKSTAQKPIAPLIDAWPLMRDNIWPISIFGVLRICWIFIGPLPLKNIHQAQRRLRHGLLLKKLPQDWIYETVYTQVKTINRRKCERLHWY